MTEVLIDGVRYVPEPPVREFGPEEVEVNGVPLRPAPGEKREPDPGGQAYDRTTALEFELRQFVLACQLNRDELLDALPRWGVKLTLDERIPMTTGALIARLVAAQMAAR